MGYPQDRAAVIARTIAHIYESQPRPSSRCSTICATKSPTSSARRCTKFVCHRHASTRRLLPALAMKGELQ